MQIAALPAAPAGRPASSQAARPGGPHSRRVRPSTGAGHAPARGLHVGSIQIPAVGISAPVITLGLNRDGTLQVPARADEAGWWSGGRQKRFADPIVLAGHVDSRTGPGVFFSLRRLRRGDRIVVSLGDRRHTFTVDRASSYPKHAFPRRLVYAATGRPALRLITCDGRFDGRSYARNLIVFAH